MVLEITNRLLIVISNFGCPYPLLVLDTTHPRKNFTHTINFVGFVEWIFLV